MSDKKSHPKPSTDKKRAKFSQYVDIEAESASTDTNESYSPVISSPVVTDTWQAFTTKLEQKYKDLGDKEDEAEAETETETGTATVRPQIALLPTASSPKLWLLRVRPGKERQAMARLLADGGEHIFAVVVKEGLPGYIYVESHYKQSVLNAIEKCRFVSGRISAVPLDEMVEAVSYRRREIAVHSYARVRRGRYRDDAALIVRKISDEMVRARLVPRVGGRRGLLVATDHESAVRVKGGVVYNKEFYDGRGFLERNFLVTELRLGETPSVREAQELREKDLRVGETVTVRTGELRTLRGTIRTKREGELVIETGSRTYAVSERDVQKSVLLGDEVGVQGGGNGVVVHIEGDDAVVALENFTREVSVKIDALTEPREPYRIKTSARARRPPRDPLINRKVTITRGQQKGFVGTVKDVHRENLLVQLQSNLKRIEVKRSEVMPYEEKKADVFDVARDVVRGDVVRDVVRDGGRDGRTPYKTPVIDGGRTPYKTPVIDRTPVAYDAAYKTPVIDRTPYKTPVIDRTPYKTPVIDRTPYKTPTAYNAAYKTPYKTPVIDGRAPYKTPAEDTHGPHDAHDAQDAFRGTQLIHDGRVIECIAIREGTVVTAAGELALQGCRFVRPAKYDRVVVLNGKNRGCSGILVRVFGEEGIVRCTDVGAINVELRDVSRMS